MSEANGMLGGWPEAESARPGFAASCSRETGVPMGRRRFQVEGLVGGRVVWTDLDRECQARSGKAGLLSLGCGCFVVAAHTIVAASTMTTSAFATVAEASAVLET